MKILLAGKIAELMKTRVFETSSAERVSDIRQQLLLKVPELTQFKMKITVNDVLADEDQGLNAEDTVFVFGAYAGG